MCPQALCVHIRKCTLAFVTTIFIHPLGHNLTSVLALTRLMHSIWLQVKMSILVFKNYFIDQALYIKWLLFGSGLNTFLGYFYLAYMQINFHRDKYIRTYVRTCMTCVQVYLYKCIHTDNLLKHSIVKV